eukprot:m.30064 g.30064  ORF g.30064 m.30064 type:complete len:1778 (+) comp12184_c0_seq1:428-5761(+)
MAAPGVVILEDDAEEEEEVPWSHLLEYNGKELFDITEPEKAWWQTMADEFPDQLDIARKRTFGKLRSVTCDGGTWKSGDAPIDFYSWRTHFAKYGSAFIAKYTKTHGKPPEFIDGGEGIRGYFAQPGFKSQRAKVLYVDKNRVYEKLFTEPSMNMDRARLAAELVIMPYERKFRYQSISVEAPEALSPRPTASFEEEFQTAGSIISVELAHQALVAGMASFHEILAKLDHSSQDDTARDKIQKAAVLLKPHIMPQDDTTQCFYTSATQVAILGMNRRGKSFTLNSMLRATEVPQSLYNIGGALIRQWQSNSAPTASDAVNMVTRMWCLDKDRRGDSQELRERRFRATADRIAALADITLRPQAPLSRKCPSEHPDVVWVLPSGPDINAEVRAVDETALAELQRTHIFDGDGRLNHNCKDTRYVRQFEKYGSDADQFRRYAADDLASIGPSAGDFLLPALGGDNSVTSVGMTVTGGNQYAFVARFASASTVDRLVAQTKAHIAKPIESDQPDHRRRLERLSAILTTLRYGLEEAVDDDASDDDDCAAAPPSDRAQWAHQTSTAPAASGSAFEWWDSRRHDARQLAEKTFQPRFDQWRKGRKGTNANDYGSNIFDLLNSRWELIKALSHLRFGDLESNEKTTWFKAAMEDDAEAFDWLRADEVEVHSTYTKEYDAWSTSNPHSDNFNGTAAQLDRVVQREADPSCVGIFRAAALEMAAEQWLNEVLHPSVRDVFGKTQIHQGTGIRLVDDRAYLKVKQDGTLKKGTVSAELIDEVVWVAPSFLFNHADPDDFGMLTDTPGLDDTDPVKIAHTRRIIHDATAILVFSDQTFESSQTLLDSMNKFDLTKNLVFHGLDGVVCTKPVSLVLNLEKGGDKPRGVPATNVDSILHREEGSTKSKISKLASSKIRESRKAFKTTITNLADDDGGIVGVRLPAGYTDCRAPGFLDPQLKKAIDSGTQLLAYPALFRGLIETPEEERTPDFADLLNATLMPKLIARVREEFRATSAIRHTAVDAVLKSCSEVHDAPVKFTTEKRTNVPECIGHAVEKCQAGKCKLAPVSKQAEKLIKLFFETSKKPTKMLAKAAETWATKGAQLIKKDLKCFIANTKGPYRFLRSASSGGAGSCFTEMVASIQAATTIGITTCDDYELTAAIWSCCNLSLNTTSLWVGWGNDAAEKCYGTLFDLVYASNFEDQLLNKMTPSDKEASRRIVSQVVSEHLRESFDVKGKLGKLEVEMNKRVLPAGKKPQKVLEFRDSSSVARRVIDGVAKAVLLDFPEDVLDSRDPSALAAELDERFTSVEVETLKTLLLDEFEKLMAGLEHDLLSWYGHSNMKNPALRSSHSRTKAAVKKVFEEIKKTSLVSDGNDWSTVHLKQLFGSRLSVLKDAGAAYDRALQHDGDIMHVCGHRGDFSIYKDFLQKGFSGKRAAGGMESEMHSMPPDCVDAAVLRTCTTIGVEEQGPLQVKLRKRFDQFHLRDLWDTHSVVTPHVLCPKEMQLASLIVAAEKASDAGAEPSAHQKRAQEVWTILERDARLLHLDGIVGKLCTLVRTQAATVFVHSRVRDETVHNWKVESKRSSANTFVLHFLLNGDTGELYLLRPNGDGLKRKRRVGTPDPNPDSDDEKDTRGGYTCELDGPQKEGLNEVRPDLYVKRPKDSKNAGPYGADALYNNKPRGTGRRADLVLEEKRHAAKASKRKACADSGCSGGAAAAIDTSYGATAARPGKGKSRRVHTSSDNTRDGSQSRTESIVDTIFQKRARPKSAPEAPKRRSSRGQTDCPDP